MKENLVFTIEKWLIGNGWGLKLSEITSVIIVLAAIIIISWLCDFLTKRILLGTLKRVILKTKTLWDDILLKKKLFNRIAHFAPAIIIYSTIKYAFPEMDIVTNLIEKAALIYMFVICIMVINSFLNGVNEIYDHTTGKAKGRSIKGYIQVLKIFAYAIFGIAILALAMNQTVRHYITGIGAIAAVLILVFKDTILGLVAGIQLSANDMLRIGDWISMPSHNADGTVMEITLNTVKVQNWDKTIATIPTYSLVSESFNNWRGMEESGGRRIKRSIDIDINSIHFCSNDELKQMHDIPELTNIIDSQQKLKKRITNSGLFKLYLEDYLQSRSDINKEMTFLVRQLETNSKGLPIEFYVFSKIQAWVDYENVQAEIMDNVLATIPIFNLRVFQEPSGQDFSSLSKR
jgi:miniconductance mechanosensitive channel